MTAQPNEAIAADQVADLPERAAQSVTGAVAEYEGQETIEVICAKDADKLECLSQAVEYADVGAKRIQDWIDSSRAARRTEFAIRVADAALSTSPLAWRE